MSNKTKVLVLNGPNLNMLGKREPEIYGTQTLQQVMQDLTIEAVHADIELTDFQSNREYELIEKIHESHQQIDFIIINPAAFTHTSVALRDALLAVNIPFIEVHISNIYQREAFRKHSYFSDVAEAVLCGFGTQGYSLALQRVMQITNDN